MHYSLPRYLSGAALLTVCGLAQAHPGHAPGLLEGIAHPWMGLDHLLAMVGVGWWATQLGGRARIVLPITFVVMMALGMATAMAGHVMPLREQGAAWSVLLLGVLIAGAWRTSLTVATGCVGAFALAHGAAHGAELQPQASALVFAAGVLASTALLHVVGLLSAGALATRGRWLRAAGVLLAGSGVFLVAA
jgi:urease accessory protein